MTTAASAGAAHDLALLWALVFSTVACFVLQESAARLTAASGEDLGRVLRRRHGRGLAGAAVVALVLGAILLGCAAYEAGNILGGVAGAVLATGHRRWVWTLICAGVAALLLAFNSPQQVARSLSVLVAAMGATFVWTALSLRPSWGELIAGALVPRAPAASGVLILGLVGTTVVPYNLFLGSGLARSQRLSEVRFGLAVAVGLGGAISAAIMVVGAAVDGAFSFAALADVLSARLAGWARPALGVGLLAAGLSSAITAPLAAAVTARGLFARSGDDPRWAPHSWRYRGAWGVVVVAGAGFGLSGIAPVPAIVAAQALNGVLLPFVAVFLISAVNDRQLLGRHVNGPLANVASGVALVATAVLGVSGVLRAGARTLSLPAPGIGATLIAAVPVLGLAALYLGRGTRRRPSSRRPGE